MSSDEGVRTQAPFGRRIAPITARRVYGAYVVLECCDPDGPLPRAGQFYMLSAARRWGGGEGERPFLPRAFSVLRAIGPAEGGPLELHFLAEDVGPGTERLCELGPGEELALVGPLGVGFRAPREGRSAVLVGGGVGIAPLAIWQEALGDVVATALGFRDAEHAHAAALLRDPQVATDDGSVGQHALVTELLEDALDLHQHAEVYACGPPGMLESVRIVCSEREVPAQLALEAPMACGFGACFGCVVPTRSGYRRLCLEGPVLDAAALHTAAVTGTG